MDDLATDFLRLYENDAIKRETTFENPITIAISIFRKATGKKEERKNVTFRIVSMDVRPL